jgi:hypothetical protein
VDRVLQPFLLVTISTRGNKVLRDDIERDSASEDKEDYRHGVRSDFFSLSCPFQTWVCPLWA